MNMLSVFISAALILFIAFGQSLFFGFIYDDLLHVTGNPLVIGTPSLLDAVIQIAVVPSPPGNLYRPVSTFAFWSVHRLFGLDPLPFHSLNLLLHLLTSSLLFVFLRSNAISRQLAFTIMALFMVHPLVVEPVVNISGQTELWAGCFGIAALLVSSVFPVVTTRRFLAILTLLILSALSKESGIAFSIMVPMVAWLRRYELRKYLLLSVGSILFVFLVRYAVVGSIASVRCSPETIHIENILCGLPVSERVLPSLWILGSNVERALLPLHLTADYSMTREQLDSALSSLPGVLRICLPFLFLAMLSLQQRRQSLFFAAWWIIASLPTMNLLFPTGTLNADRLSYVPLMAFVSGLLVHLSHLPQRYLGGERAKSTVAVLLGASLLVLSAQRTSVWSSPATFYRAMVKDAPESPKAHYNLAIHQLIEESDIAGAEQALLTTLRLHPQEARASQALAEIALQRGDLTLAERWLERAVRDAPSVNRYREQLMRIQKFQRGRSAKEESSPAM